MFTWFGPIAYRRKLTADGRGIKAQATVQLRDRAPVMFRSDATSGVTMTVGIVLRVTEHPADEIWAELALEDQVREFTPKVYPQIDLDRDFDLDTTFTHQAWFNSLTIIGVTLGHRPAWPKLRPIQNTPLGG